MSKRATAIFEIKGWDEKPYDEMEGGPKLSRARVNKVFHGDVEGNSALEYLLVYRQDGTASFIGFERVVGCLQGRPGTFVLKHEGTFEGGTATATCSVVPGSGTGELKALRGQGSFAAGHAQTYPFSLDFELD